MDKFPMMVYKAPGPEFLHGFDVGLKTELALHEEDLVEAKKQGWFETTTEAVEAFQKVDDSPATRTELETKARELGIKFDEFTTDADLSAAIDADLKG